MTRELERQIVDRVLGGDKEAFEALVLDNERRIYNLCLRKTGNEQDAYDLAQEVFIKAYNSLGGFRGECAFSTWLFRLASNLCIDFYRENVQYSAHSMSLEATWGGVAEMDFPDNRHLPEDELGRREAREKLYHGLSCLSLEHRTVLILREFDQLSYGEIAELLDISPGTVKSRISRARKQLAATLRKDSYFAATT